MSWTIRFGAVLCALSLIMLGCDGASEEQLEQKSDVRTLTGVLRNDDTSPAGQTTGWSVKEAGTGLIIPVDLAGVIAMGQQFNGKRVIIRGTMMERLDAGGTKREVFVAESITGAAG